MCRGCQQLCMERVMAGAVYESEYVLRENPVTGMFADVRAVFVS